jgi:hypothetical protein
MAEAWRAICPASTRSRASTPASAPRASIATLVLIVVPPGLMPFGSTVPDWRGTNHSSPRSPTM